MADFTMPALGADMETGRLVQWCVQPGARVRPGDVVAVVETHKGAIDVECFLDGVIEDLAPLGQDLPVGAVLARVRGGAEAAAVTAPEAIAGPATSKAPGRAAALAAPDAPSAPSALAAPSAPSALAAPSAPSALAAPSAPSAPPGAGGAGAAVAVSPAARRRAAERGLNPFELIGTGADGAVTLADVDRAVAPVPRVAPTPATTPAVRAGFDPALMRQAIATAMARSKREIPHYYLASTIDFHAAQAWLDAYNAPREPADRLLPAVLLLKACARALAEVPQLNGFFDQGAFRAGPGIHIGWAIALRGGGLVAPALHDADRQPLPELMQALRGLVQRARAGGLRSSELSDPTVTVTNVGERGAESVLGVIYPPQVAILGFGRILQRPWVVAGQVLPRPLVTATLAADHRVSDGHLGGLLLAAVDRALQDPQAL